MSQPKPAPGANVPPFNVCVAKPLKVPPGAPPRDKFITVGVAWPTSKGDGLRCVFDLTFILTPSDRLVILPNRNHPDHANKPSAIDGTFGAPEVVG